MPTTAPAFELDRFERIEAGRGTVLLRVSGRWRAAGSARVPEVRLVVDAGGTEQRIAALPSPAERASAGAPAGWLPWRAAFPVSAGALTATGARFALETAGTVVGLPAPAEISPRAARQALAPGRGAGPAEDAERRRAEDERAHAARRRREAMRVLEERVDAERRAHAAAEREASDAREELARLRAEVRAARQSGDERVRELGEQVARLEHERAEADLATRAARAHIAAARAELEERLAAERAARGELRAQRDEARGRASAARAEASAAQEAQAVLAARAATAEKVVETARLIERERDRAVIAARAAQKRAEGAVDRLRRLERERDDARSRAEGAQRAERRVAELKQRIAELERARVRLAAQADRVPQLEQVLREREETVLRLTAERSETAAIVARLRDDAGAAEQRIAAEHAARQDAEATAEGGAARVGELEEALAGAEDEMRALVARLAGVEQASARRAATLERERDDARARSTTGPSDPDPPRVAVPPQAAPRFAYAAMQRLQRAWRERPGADPAGRREIRPADDRRARLFVWTVWALVLATSAYLVLRAGRDIPIQEDWKVIAAATGNQYDFWGWVWEPNNEHRVPIAKLVYVALFQLWPDFRVGMIFNLAALAGIAAAFVLVLRRLRGYTRWTDAFFPLIFLHLGNWENFGWSWQLTFVIAAAVAAAMLMVLALPGRWTTRRAALLVGCMLVTPFTGATALPFAAAVAVAALLECRKVAGRPRTVLVAGSLLTLLLSGLYFIGLPQSTWVPGNPGPVTDLWTGGKFLALGLGPAAGGWWLLSVVAVWGALASAAWLLWRARHRGGLLLLAYLAAGVVLAVSLGRGRSGAEPFYGLPDRYVLVAIPVICAIFLVWERFGGARVRRLGSAALCVAMLLLLPLNSVYGAQWKDWYHDRVDTFAADVEAGVPLAQLMRYRPLAQDPQEMALGMLYMSRYDIGVFKKVRLVPKPVQAWPIDGFSSGGAGWETLRGPESRARLVRSHGRPEMRWSYNATSKKPAVLGRRFARPENWTGAGALAVTVKGEATGRRVRIRLTVDAPGGGIEHFDTWFTDETASTKTLVVPWNGFGRANVRGEFIDILKGPLPSSGIRSVTFIIGDTGPGVLRIRRLALTPGHPQLGWPLHSAVERRSLPPLQ